MKVLIADDDLTTRKLLERTISKWGYEVVSAADGDAAWQLLTAPDAPRLAVLDWMMPGKTGLELCQALKQTASIPYVYVLLLTSKSGKEDVVAGLDAGADDFLIKPVDAGELRSRLAVGNRILSALPPRQVTSGPHMPGYQILDPLGKGARGIVYRGIQLGTKREVAIKFIAVELLNEKSKARFTREVELMAKLDHPHIVKVFDSRLDVGHFGYAMELVGTEDVSAYTKSHKLSPRKIIEVMAKAADAVGHAHARGVVHRDLKPSNVLMTPAGEPKLVDFGLAKSLEESDEHLMHLTAEGHIVGTPAFMSPEQARCDAAAVGPRSDVYSLGVILYRLLIDQHPHELKPPIHDMLRRIADEPIREPRQFQPNIDPRLERVMLKALAKAPADRYADGAEFAYDLQGLLGRPSIIQSP